MTVVLEYLNEVTAILEYFEHILEGFALLWSPPSPATGLCARAVYLGQPAILTTGKATNTQEL